MSLLVIITCYRVPDLAIECLKSLAHEIGQVPDLKVGICDNGNEDDSLEQLNRVILENDWQSWVHVTSIRPNRGFAGGNNVILRESLKSSNIPDYFLLLNADTLVRPGALSSLLKAADTHKNAGIFCPRLEWPSGEAQISCFRYISPISELLSAAKTKPLTRLFKKWEVPMPVVDIPIEIEWGSFACALIRKEVFFDIGVLDEGYYLYYDDVDYCRSANKAGWKILYWPDAHIVHLRGKSNPVKENTAQRKRRPSYWYISRNWYFSKFYGKLGLFAANMLWLAGRSISFSRELLMNKKPHLCKMEEIDIWKGFCQNVTPKVEI